MGGNSVALIYYAPMLAYLPPIRLEIEFEISFMDRLQKRLKTQNTAFEIYLL